MHAKAAKTIFWDVDTQNDFILKDGKLAIAGAEEILENLEKLTDYARRHGIQVIASVCDHTPDDDEISEQPDFEQTYPPHCIRGTQGQQKVKQTLPQNALFIEHAAESERALRARLERHTGEVVIKKKHFDVFSNPNTATLLKVLQPDRIVVYGVALDVCDKYAIEGFLARTNAQVVFVQDAAHAIREERRPQLLDSWKKRGVQIVNSENVLREIGDRHQFP